MSEFSLWVFSFIDKLDYLTSYYRVESFILFLVLILIFYRLILCAVYGITFFTGKKKY